MSLQGHVYRRPFQRAASLDGIWIGDSPLRTLYNDFTRQRGCKRHGSSVPGPMEARRRATRRRLVYSAPPPVTSPLDYINEMWGEREQSKRTSNAELRSTERVKSDSSSHQDESGSSSLLAAISDRVSSAVQVIYNSTRAATTPSIQAQSIESDVYDIDSLIRQAVRCNSLTELHQLNETSAFNIRDHSRSVFQSLMHADKPLSMLLDFIVDPILSVPGSLHLYDLLTREASIPRPRFPAAERARLIASWTGAQIVLGNLTNAQIHAVASFAQATESGSGGKRNAYWISKAIFQSIERSKVLDLQDINYRTITLLMECLVRGAPSAKLSRCASIILRQMDTSLLLRLRPSISRCILRALSKTYITSSVSSEVSNEDWPSFEVVFGSFMDEIPNSEKLLILDCVSEVLVKNTEGFCNQVWNDLSEGWWNALSQHSFDRHISAPIGSSLMRSEDQGCDGYLHLFARYLTRFQLARLVLRQWSGFSESATRRIEELLKLREANDILWSLVCFVHAAGDLTDSFIRKLFRLLLNSGYRGAIIDITRKAGENDVALPSPELGRILTRLAMENSSSAQALFTSDNRLGIEECLNLADQSILASDEPSGQTFKYFRTENATAVPMFDKDVALENCTDGANALTTHATAHAFRKSHYTSSQAFDLLHQCQKLHRKRQSDHNSVSLSRSFVSMGIVLPLSRGEPVDPQHKRTILNLVGRTEGWEVASEIGRICEKWQREASTVQADTEGAELDASHERTRIIDDDLTCD